MAATAAVHPPRALEAAPGPAQARHCLECRGVEAAGGARCDSELPTRSPPALQHHHLPPLRAPRPPGPVLASARPRVVVTPPRAPRPAPNAPRAPDGGAGRPRAGFTGFTGEGARQS